ncbi:substrate-binding domain-containing protein [Clostridium sp. MCC353]|uniref:substrate-binding domain-containing protein n=1 Tax=Clostridium sp. MCC353 TaxID=2592646 RepID=UPI001C034829|nr:substrate-binding domain-containing protein [Clostridium sp. MCC353]MBT9777557.1 substrate-binding domain-containing protein [Clostridium sp. MCC353]
MKKCRKWLAALGMILALLSASACGGEKKVQDISQEEGSTKEAPGPQLKIGVCIYNFDDKFMSQYRDEIEKYLSEVYNAEVLTVNGRGSQEEQNRQIDQFLEQGYDGLIVNVIQADQAEELVNKCSGAQVPVVFINRAPKEEEIRRWKDENIAASYVGTDARQSGTYQGEIILETPNKGDFNGDGKISYVMITGADDNLDAEYRTEYSIKALEDAGIKTKCLTKRSGSWNQKEGYQLVSNALFQYGREIEVVFCNNDAMANGARSAILEAGRTVGDDICLVGVDALRDTVGYVEEGTVTGTVFNDYATQAHTAADAVVKMIRGEKTDKEYTVDYIKVVGDLTNKIIGFCVPKTKEDEELKYREEIKERLEQDYNAKVLMAEVEGDWDSMVKEINTFSDLKVNALIIDMSEVTDSKKVEKKCREAGLSALLLNTPEETEEPAESDLEVKAGEGEDSAEKNFEETRTVEEDRAVSAGLAADEAVRLAKKQYWSVTYQDK